MARKRRTTTPKLRTVAPPPRPWGYQRTTAAQFAARQAQPLQVMAVSTKEAKLNTSDNWDATAIK